MGDIGKDKERNMQSKKLDEILTQNAYPGRGIVLGLCPDGKTAMMAYFIMGRSENSRNRVFTEQDGGIITEAADPAKMEDPSLIIYAPVRKVGQRTVVTNGDQTDTIVDCLLSNVCFEDALRSRTFEPDAPNYTPRISGILLHDMDSFCYKLSILKSAGGNATSVQRFFFDYEQPVAGQGHFIHTYKQDGSPLPSFEGEPVAIEVPQELDVFGDSIWRALDKDNKVSLFVRSIASDGSEQTKIYNKLQKI